MAAVRVVPERHVRVVLGKRKWDTLVEIDGHPVYPRAFVLRFDPDGTRVIELTLADVEVVPAPER